MAEQWHPLGGRSQLEDRRQRRLEQLRHMSEEAFAAEVRRHQAARWPRQKLHEHARKHWRDFEAFLGRGLSPGELEELSRTALHSWDRLLTDLEPNGDVSYVFSSRLAGQGDILVVVTRRGLIRTAIPMDAIDAWLERHQTAVEVTDRAEKLGL